MLRRARRPARRLPLCRAGSLTHDPLPQAHRPPDHHDRSRPRPDHGRRRLPAGARGLPTPRSSTRSTPPTSGSASAPASSAAASPPPTRRSSTCPSTPRARPLRHGRARRQARSTPSSSPPSPTPTRRPAAAPILADRLGIQAAAFDISAACAGYCHGIALANDMVRGGSATHVLVIGVEKLLGLHRPLRPRHRVHLRRRRRCGDRRPVGHARPSARPSGARTAPSGRPSPSATPGSRPARSRSTVPAITMAGQSVFRWAVWGMAPVAQKAIDAAGIRAEDLDAFIPHQANMRIIDAMIKQLKLPDDIAVARDIAETANTSRGVDPAGDRADAARGRGAARRPRPADRLRRGPGLRRAGRGPALRLPPARRMYRRHAPPSNHTQRTTRSTQMAQTSRRSSRAWPRSSTRRPVSTPTRSSPRSPSPTTSTSTPCR